MTRRLWWILGLGALALLLLPSSKRMAKEHGLFKGLGPARIAILPVLGEISDSDFTVRWLQRLGRDVRGVKAVVLQIDTPGGGVAPSQEICQAIYRLRDEEGIVVVASMGGMATSGGYYIASACDEIIANPGTVTGSIGVIMETVHVEELLRKVGARFETVKSGLYKDSGSFNRPMTAGDRRLFQQAIDDVADQFVEAVAEGRREALAEALVKRDGGKAEDLSDAQVKAYVHSLADGRIYTGRQALGLGLVDKLGGLQDAIDRAADLADIKDPQVVTLRENRSLAQWVTGLGPGQWRSFFKGLFTAQAPQLKLLLR